jgi:hypothetical protein
MNSDLKNICRDFMRGNCERNNCRFTHDTKLCKNWYRNFQINGEGSCKFGVNCRKNHFAKSVGIQTQSRKPKNVPDVL